MGEISGFRFPVKEPKSHYYILCRFFCEELGKFLPAIFLIDTGAATTTIIAEAFGLNFKRLEEGSEVLTPAGFLITKKVHNATIAFTTSEGEIHVENLDEVDVISLKPPPSFHGMLGMDIFNRFKKTETNGRKWIFHTNQSTV
ncbi:hypothetical protein DRO48_03685 [Candidatus Bathyarchaeota archaeon]|nr:MAG: hypothetical protein DRO48_03685 [Candidatus Bathyarchaeota archaeon]